MSGWQYPPSPLEQLAERFERETRNSDLDAVNRVRRMLFGILPEDFSPARPDGHLHLIRRSDTFSPSDAEKDNL